MIEYRVRLVGDPMGPWKIIAAANPTEAIAEATGCGTHEVRGFSRPRVGTERYGLTSDGSLQYWDVEEPRFVPIIARLALFAKMRKDDIFRADAERRAVEEVVEATGMFYDDARRQVRIWLISLDSPHRDTIGLHADD
jgi:hypothetical protein